MSSLGSAELIIHHDPDTEEDGDNSLDPQFSELTGSRLCGEGGCIHMEDVGLQWKRNKCSNLGADSVIQGLTIEEFVSGAPFVGYVDTITGYALSGMYRSGAVSTNQVYNVRRLLYVILSTGKLSRPFGDTTCTCQTPERLYRPLARLVTLK